MSSESGCPWIPMIIVGMLSQLAPAISPRLCQCLQGALQHQLMAGDVLTDTETVLPHNSVSVVFSVVLVAFYLFIDLHVRIVYYY